MTDPRSQTITSLAGQARGEWEDPYADLDISELPDWWRKAIQTHRKYGLRPYRPPRFTDEELLPPVIRNLESKLDADIRLIRRSNSEEGTWTFYVNGEPIMDIGYRREPDGYSVFECTSENFIERAHRHLGDDHFEE